MVEKQIIRSGSKMAIVYHGQSAKRKAADGGFDPAALEAEAQAELFTPSKIEARQQGHGCWLIAIAERGQPFVFGILTHPESIHEFAAIYELNTLRKCQS